MKIVIVSPPVRDMYFTPGRSSALGMYTLSKILKKLGNSVTTFNCPLLHPEGRTIPPLKETEHLQKFIIQGERGKLSFFSGYKQFGPSFQTCAKKILEHDPDCILISSFAFAYAGDTLELIKSLRELEPGCLIGAGGGGVSSYPEYYLKAQGADFVVTGEAENVMGKLMKELHSNSSDLYSVPNLYFKHDGKIISPSKETHTQAENLEFVWSKTGETKQKVFISTSLSRGCPRRCRFCSTHITHGHLFRYVPLEKIKKELAFLPANKHIVLNFEDDNLTFVPEYFFQVLSLFHSHFPDITFIAENGIDYSFLNPEKVKKLVQLGFKQFNLSLGTLSSDTAQAEKRIVSLEKYEIIIREIQKYTIPVISYFICGLQNDTPENIVKTLAYLMKVPTLVGISPFYPVPGLYGYTNKNVFKTHTSSLCRGASFYPWNNTVSTQEMVTAFRISRFINFFKQKQYTQLEKELLTRIIETKTLHTIVRRNKRNTIVAIPYMEKEMVALFFESAFG